MKKILFWGCFLVLCSISCKEDMEEASLKSSYYLAIDGMGTQQTANNICQIFQNSSTHTLREIDTGNFVFTGTYTYYERNFNLDVSLVTYIQDTLGMGQPFAAADIQTYLTDKPDKVSFEIKIEIDGETYKNAWYRSMIPSSIFIFPSNFDVTATQSSNPIDDVQIVDCVSNSEQGAILPIEYSYQGWIYTNEKADSLYVDSLYCSYYLYGE